MRVLYSKPRQQNKTQSLCFTTEKTNIKNNINVSYFKNFKRSCAYYYYDMVSKISKFRIFKTLHTYCFCFLSNFTISNLQTNNNNNNNSKQETTPYKKSSLQRFKSYSIAYILKCQTNVKLRRQ